MRLKCMILSLLAALALMATAQPVQQQEEWEWYLDEVVNDVLVGRNYFEYYYMPSASDMQQQRDKGEVSYFLNSPAGLNSKKVRDMIDRIMANYDDIKAVSDWHMTTATYWKEFRHEKNKFRFSVKRKALDDGTYYVSVTETANAYKSLGKKSKDSGSRKQSSPTRSTKRSNRDRHPVTVDDEDTPTSNEEDLLNGDEPSVKVVSEKERRQAAREREEALRQEQRLAKRRAQEQQREEAKAQKEAEKQRKAELKKQKEEEKRLKKEEQRRQREQERLDRQQAQRDKQAAASQQAAAAKTAASKYNCDDVALWLSEKYGFTQTSGSETSCTMFSTAVKDVEMAKLAIKNALKGSNARMAVPWRLNSETQAVETGYTVDGHVLVFAIGKNDDGNITLTITQVSAQELDDFKHQLGSQD